MEKSEIEKFSFKVGQEVFVITEILPGTPAVQPVRIISYDVDTVCAHDGGEIIFVPFQGIFIERKFAEQAIKV